ncbi:cupin-like domain-containing protein [Microbulbifer sp. TYP-18]|uniref:cupin-like domain-containing protein n=1 Tax=Microbulbifer sp. TYP-18 TaxID=3230024 RepID=UPI0034C5E01B
MQSFPIERVTLSDFFERCYAQSYPVVITDVVQKWPAFDCWSPEYFVHTMAEKRVQVAYTQEDTFAYQNGEPKYGRVNLPLAQALEKVLQTQPDGVRFFLMQQPMASAYPELMDDIRIPDWLDENLITINFWVGSKGAFTPLHFDTEDNFIAQVFGRKRFTLYDPAQLDCLYPNDKTDKYSHLSRVNIAHPDHHAHPQFHHAEPITVTLDAGEMLYLPSHWWHAVQSINVNAMVNFWQQSNDLKLYLENPTGIHSLWYLYQDNLLQSLDGLLDAKNTSFLACAEVMLNRDRQAAVLLAHAGLIDALMRLDLCEGETKKSPNELQNLIGEFYRRGRLSDVDLEKIQNWRFLALQTFTDEVGPADAAAMVDDVKLFLQQL